MNDRLPISVCLIWTIHFSEFSIWFRPSMERAYYWPIIIFWTYLGPTEGRLFLLQLDFSLNSYTNPPITYTQSSRKKYIAADTFLIYRANLNKNSMCRSTNNHTFFQQNLFVKNMHTLWRIKRSAVVKINSLK